MQDKLVFEERPKSKPQAVPDNGQASLDLLSMIARRLAEGLEASPFLSDTDNNDISSSREICLAMWPFIRELPDNICAVRTKLSQLNTKLNLNTGLKLLDQLADEEREYQNLYLNQCTLAGISKEELAKPEWPAQSVYLHLTELMRSYCLQGSVQEGVLSVVTAELAATQFARQALSVYETYFSKNEKHYGKDTIENGLAWLRLHAKPNTRHAIWMRRMILAAFENEQIVTTDNFSSASNSLAAPVEEILGCLFSIWGVSTKTDSYEVSKISNLS